jgi:prepilin-type N-terminal cleavage/methylation domain-containing protein
MRSANKGFTLVELIVVIAIIAILASVSIVGYNQFIQNARDSRASTELDVIVRQLEAEYYVDGYEVETLTVYDSDYSATAASFTLSSGAFAIDLVFEEDNADDGEENDAAEAMLLELITDAISSAVEDLADTDIVGSEDPEADAEAATDGALYVSVEVTDVTTPAVTLEIWYGVEGGKAQLDVSDWTFTIDFTGYTP